MCSSLRNAQVSICFWEEIIYFNRKALNTEIEKDGLKKEVSPTAPLLVKEMDI